MVPRTRLFARLDEAFREAGIVWIEGPPGAGKTTLAASWLDAQRNSCIWYQIDAGDRDPASFFHYFGIAVSQRAPRYRRPMPKLTPEYLRGLETFARNFFRELARRLEPPFVLVFDNLQHLGADAALFDLLRHGLEELPAEGRALREPPTAD